MILPRVATVKQVVSSRFAETLERLSQQKTRFTHLNIYYHTAGFYNSIII